MESFTINLNCQPQKCLNRGIQKNYTFLPEKIELDGYWECALANISFKKTMYNIKDKQFINLIYYAFDQTKTVQIMNPIEPGDYSYEELIDRLNDIIKIFFEDNDGRLGSERIPMNKKPKFFIKENKIAIQLGVMRRDWGDFVYVQPSEIVCEMLGFDRQEIYADSIDKIHRLDNKEERDRILEDEQIMFQKYFHKHFEMNSFYICSDIAKPLIFGGVYQPLLRHVNIDKLKFGERKNIEFEDLHFIKVRKNPISRVEVYIFKNLNYISDSEVIEDFVNFEFGEMFMTLVFRKISNEMPIYEEEIEKDFNRPKEDPFKVITFNPEIPPVRPMP